MILNQYKDITVLYLILVSCLLLTTMRINVIYGENFTSYLYSPSEAPSEMSYGYLMTKYWDWWINVPSKPDSPNNESPFPISTCDVKDTGEVVFLVDALKVPKSMSYSCNLSEGKPLFFPLISSEYDQMVENYENATDQRLIDAAKEDNLRGTYELKIDGTIIPQEQLKKLQMTSPFWNISIVEPNNMYGAPIGHPRAVVDGIFAYVKPLSLGSHEIQYKVAEWNDATQLPNPEVIINYKILIGPDSQE